MELVVGRAGRAHGVRGEVSVEVRTDSPETRFVAGAKLGVQAGDGAAPPDGIPRQLSIESCRWHSGRLLVGFDGIDDRTAAERLRGCLLVVEVPDDERPTDPDEFYDHQLVGLQVHTGGPEPVGVVDEVIHLPMQELLAVRLHNGREALVPFVRDIVTDIDLTAGQVRIDPPAGLLDELDSSGGEPTG